MASKLVWMRRTDAQKVARAGGGGRAQMEPPPATNCGPQQRAAERMQMYANDSATGLPKAVVAVAEKLGCGVQSPSEGLLTKVRAKG